MELRGRVVAPCPIARLSSRSVPRHDGEAILDLNVGPNAIRLGAHDAERSLPRLRRRHLPGDLDRWRRAPPEWRASRRHDRHTEEQLLTHEGVRDLRLK